MPIMPDRITDGPDDNWPGDADSKDLLRHMSDAEIREILNDLPLETIVWSEINLSMVAGMPVDDCELGRRMRKLIQPKIAKAVE